jgi:hypothetical protein
MEFKSLFMSQIKRYFVLAGILIFYACSDEPAKTKSTLAPINTLTNEIARNTYATQIKPGDPITFKVAEVELAEQLLEVYDSKKIFEHKTGKKIKYMPDVHTDQKYVFANGNVFIQTLQECFDEHRPLKLSPDVIWLTICQGVSIHINENFDSLETLIFKKNRPKKLIVRNDSLENNSRQWVNLIDSLSAQTSQHVKKNFHSFFVPTFSTTTREIKTAYEITLMHSFKKAFDYVGESGCGIPTITLTGNRHDWVSIQTRLRMLTELGLDDWRLELEPIIAEFINVYDGKVNSEFWKKIYKNMRDYNAFYISGWILKFFPYVIVEEYTKYYDEELHMDQVEEKFVRNKFLKGDQYLLSTLSTSDFPSGILEIEIVWNNYFKQSTEKMAVYGGFFAIKQYEDKTLEPVISWAICEEDAKKSSHEFEWKPSLIMEHNGDPWTPEITKKVTNKPILMPEKFEDSEQSILYLKSILKDSLKTNFNYADIKNSSVTFIVLTNGHIENVVFTGDTETGSYIEKLLKSYNGFWFPALAKGSDVFMMWENFYGEDLKIKVNYKVELKFD